jgi:hypothetical protein
MKERAPDSLPPAHSPTDFLLEWYKLQRAHELELNKATLAYELELAKLLVLLNGAAAGAFLTLTGAVWKEGPRPAFWGIAGAIICWLLGLLVAAGATDWAYGAQKEYTKAYRLRRNGEELRRIEGTGIRRRHLGIDAYSVDDAEEKADAARKLAGRWSKFVPMLRYGAVFLFFVGGCLAVAAFHPSWSSPPRTIDWFTWRQSQLLSIGAWV